MPENTSRPLTKEISSDVAIVTLKHHRMYILQKSYILFLFINKNNE